MITKEKNNGISLFSFFVALHMYLVKTPWLLRKMFSSALRWKISVQENEIFLTFDDGPHPTITPFVLNNLRKYNAKATFFCIGKNVLKHPAIFRQILDEGHRIGNHTHNHLNGWKTSDSKYLENVMLARKYIDSNLFRPPYGRITRFQAQQLKAMFDIIMWDVLSGDFDVNLSPQKCLQNVVSNTKPGSIIVFHDSEKAFPRLEYALPKALQFFAEKGCTMKAIKINSRDNSK
ncbi:polysaccharide deacetylase family protein [Segetibacter koreensis]|uniref:polysaccharide deacetylase family protein n=1 Tax=Segetibacter koreensis TaxID=398037 RepID=UPI00035FCBFB|nr:polysaccharide deacetylase family protein [Segetibacter koreensis]